MDLRVGARHFRDENALLLERALTDEAVADIDLVVASGLAEMDSGGLEFLAWYSSQVSYKPSSLSGIASRADPSAGVAVAEPKLASADRVD